MMRTTILFCLLLLGLDSHAQQFEWACSGSKLQGGIQASAIDGSGNIIVAGVNEQPSFYTGNAFLFNSRGDSMEMDNYTGLMFIISFDPAGRINWKREIKNGGKAIGIGIDKNKHILLFAAADPYGSNIPELNAFIGSRVNFLYTLDEAGVPLNVVSDTNNMMDEVTSFSTTSDNKMIITGNFSSNEGGPENGPACYSYVMKIDSNFQQVWQKKIDVCHVYGPTCLANIGGNGDIYFCISTTENISFGEDKNFTVTHSPGHIGNSTEAFLACYDKSGKLKWAKRSGGTAISFSIKATANGVLLGGLVEGTSFFGEKIDTALHHKMILSGFDSKGNLLWAKTSVAEKVSAITTDHDDNVYIVADMGLNNSQFYGRPMPYETDTVYNILDELLIASYTANGAFRWIKNGKVPMNSNERPQVITDNCGNIYVSGQLFTSLRGQLKCFDAAFVKGTAYGPTPFLAKLKNTLPQLIADKIPGVKKSSCVVSPAPWTLMNFPNPFRDQTTLRYKTTYDDNVSIYVYDMKGDLISTLFLNKPLKAGTYTTIFPANGLSKGVYIVELKGTEAAAVQQIVIL